MKVTKYPQSCLVVEKEGSRILIDPGNFAMAEFKRNDFGKIDAVLITHQHSNQKYPADPHEFAKAIGNLFKVIILPNAQSVEI